MFILVKRNLERDFGDFRDFRDSLIRDLEIAQSAQPEQSLSTHGKAMYVLCKALQGCACALCHACLHVYKNT